MAEAHRHATRPPRTAAPHATAARHAVVPRLGYAWRPGGLTTVSDVLALQRQAGNAAVAEAIAPEAAANPPAPGRVAEKAFRKGEKAYARGAFGEAYDYFTQAQDLLDIPEIAYSRAQCLRRMGGRTEDAIALFQRYLADQPTGSHARFAAYWIAELEGAAKTGS